MLIDVGIAHQKKIRDKKALSDLEGLFGDYWSSLNLNIKDTVIKEIDKKTASKIICEYEWLGCMPAITLHCYGIFFSGVCGGVVCFSPEYIENLGRWDKYDYTGKILLLSRGVCLHWTPKNTGSYLIMNSIKMLPEKYKIITATTDHLAGEVGTIYQACSFYYVGSMRDSNPNIPNSKNGDRDAWVINGKMYGARALRLKYGNTKIETLKKYNDNVLKVKQNSKHRYFFFRGTDKEKKYYKSKIEYLIKEYPKRKSTGML